NRVWGQNTPLGNGRICGCAWNTQKTLGCGNAVTWLRSGRRPLWVISRHSHCKTSCPLYTRKRTFCTAIAVSAYPVIAILTWPYNENHNFARFGSTGADDRMGDRNNRRVLIAGAGPVGLLTAYLLGRRGVPVRVFERNPGLLDDPRAATTHPATLDLL